jgi:hypothetical protein
MGYCTNKECKHYLATGAAAEYEAGIDICKECQVPLVAELSAEWLRQDVPAPEEEWVTVANMDERAIVSTMIEMIKTALQRRRIDPIIKGYDHTDPWGKTPGLSEVSFMVKKADMEKAQEVVADLLKKIPSKCPECKLSLTEGHEKCPACGAVLILKEQ